MGRAQGTPKRGGPGGGPGGAFRAHGGSGFGGSGGPWEGVIQVFTKGGPTPKKGGSGWGVVFGGLEG